MIFQRVASRIACIVRSRRAEHCLAVQRNEKATERERRTQPRRIIGRLARKLIHRQ